MAGLVPDDITGWREPGPDGKPVWVEGILKKGEMRKDDAQMLIMRARVSAGWIAPDAIEEMLAEQAQEAEPELTEEEKALMALGDLGSGGPSDEDVDKALEELEFDLEALAAEGGDEEAAPKD